MDFSVFPGTIENVVHRGVISMEHNPFMRGMGLGMLAGAALGLAVSPGRKTVKRKAAKAARTMEDMAENISNAMNR